MRNFLFIFGICMSALLASCSSTAWQNFRTKDTYYPERQGTEIPSESWKQYYYDDSPTKISGLTEPRFWGKTAKTVYRKLNGEYVYLTGMDIPLYEQASINQRKDIVGWLYQSLYKSRFSKSYFHNHFKPMCAANIIDAVNSNLALGNEGWNIFRLPTNDAESLNVVSEGNDWFRVQSGTDSQNIVRIRMLLTGNELRPVITAMQNTSNGISVADASIDGAKGCNLVTYLPNYYPNNVARRTQRYTSSLAKEVYGYAEQNPSLLEKGYVGTKTLNGYGEFLIKKNEDYVKDFYADLISGTFDQKLFDKKYGKKCRRSIYEAVTERRKKVSNHRMAGWQLFGCDEPESQYSIRYEGEGWYEVLVKGKENNPVYIKPALLNNKKQTPVIIGLRNSAYHINIW